MRWPELDEPELVQVEPAEGIDSGAPVSDDRVRVAMADHREAVYQLLPYALCTREVCRNGCDVRTRAEGQRVALEIAPTAKREWTAAGGSVQALAPIARQLGDGSDGDARIAYCAAAHLAAQGDAFTVKRRVDIKPQLIEGIRSAIDSDA